MYYSNFTPENHIRHGFPHLDFRKELLELRPGNRSID